MSQEMFQIALLVIIALLVGGITIAVVLGSRLQRLLRDLVLGEKATYEKIPSPTLVERLNSVNERLNQTIETHRKTIDELPVRLTDTVAMEVSRGVKSVITSITDLTSVLKKSHEYFQAAVMTLGEPGELQNWVGTLMTVVQPLQVIESSLDGYYDTCQHVLVTTRQLLEQWASSRTTIEQAHQRLVELLTRWSQEEVVSRQEIERRIMERLKELGEQSQLVAENLSTMQTEVLRLSNSVETLSATTERATEALSHLTEIQDKVVQTQQEVIGQQRSSAKQLEETSREVSERLVALQRQVEGLTGQVATSLSTVIQSVKQSVEMLRDKHKADLEQSLQTFQATMSEQQALSQMLIRGQEEFITKATEAVDRLPQRNDFRAIIKLLIAAIAMMVVQVIITGVVVYGIFTR
jgi:hypothetical protein